MSKRTPGAKRISAADIDSATRIADDFAASLTSITAAFAVGLTDDAPGDPLAASLAFQRLSVEAAVLSRAIMARYWRGEQKPRVSPDRYWNPETRKLEPIDGKWPQESCAVPTLMLLAAEEARATEAHPLALIEEQARASQC